MKLKNLTNTEILDEISKLRLERNVITEKISRMNQELRRREKSHKRNGFQYFSKTLCGQLDEYSKPYKTEQEAKKWYKTKGKELAHKNNIELVLIEI